MQFSLTSLLFTLTLLSTTQASFCQPLAGCDARCLSETNKQKVCYPSEVAGSKDYCCDS